jgi:hypothetical protein
MDVHQPYRWRTSMSDPHSFAYSLCQDEDGWRWCVYDEEGVTIADGANGSREAAQAAVELTFRQAGGTLAA